MQRDYLVRTIEHFVQALLSITKLRKAKEYDQAKKALQTTASSLLKIDLSLLSFTPLAHIQDLFKDYTGRLETDRCALAAELILEQAFVEEALDHHALALHFKQISLYLFALSIPLEPSLQRPEIFAKVEALKQEAQEFPPEIVEALFKVQSFLKD